MAESLPVIDFSCSDRRFSANLLVKAMETVGFVYLDNIPGYDIIVEKSFKKLQNGSSHYLLKKSSSYLQRNGIVRLQVFTGGMYQSM